VLRFQHPVLTDGLVRIHAQADAAEAFRQLVRLQVEAATFSEPIVTDLHDPEALAATLKPGITEGDLWAAAESAIIKNGGWYGSCYCSAADGQFSDKSPSCRANFHFSIGIHNRISFLVYLLRVIKSVHYENGIVLHAQKPQSQTCLRDPNLQWFEVEPLLPHVFV
jgi:hypothetical protein